MLVDRTLLESVLSG